MKALEMIDFFLARGYKAEGYDLRVTERCAVDDLGVYRESPEDGREPEYPDYLLEDLEDEQKAVQRFIRERKALPAGGRKVSPLTHDRDVHVLSIGARTRACTWHDEREKVVWLLAVGGHTSGAADDFFPWVKDLDRGDVLLPSERDYEVFFDEQNLAMAEAIRINGPFIVAKARSEGHEIEVRMGGAAGPRVAVEVAGEFEEISFSVRADEITNYRLIAVIQAALDPTGPWEQAEEMPGRALRASEIAFRCLREGRD